jgi:1-acyl-sn-glycerol-3-phosphate acyltransferase
MGIKDWASEFQRFVDGGMGREVRARLERVPELMRDADAAGYDPFGANREDLAQIMPWVCFLYKCYFRTEVHGLERVAAMKRALIIPNHMTPAPVDGLNIAAAFFLDAEPPRMIRAIVHYILAELPFLNMLVSRAGQIIGCPDNVRRVFSDDNIILLFPEGAGAFRLYKDRYKLNEFQIGFMEMAIRYDYPIIPTAIIGSEESTMILREVKPLNGKFGFINFPITPTFPWLGLAGIFPMPAKFRIWFGEPMDFSQHKDKLDDPDQIRILVDQVKQRVQDMLDEHLAQLPAVPFF